MIFFSKKAESLVFFKQITDRILRRHPFNNNKLHYYLKFINGYRRSLIKSKVKEITPCELTLMRASIWKPCRVVYRPSLRFPSYLAHLCTLTNWLRMWNSLAQNSIVLEKCQSNGLTVKWTKISCRNDLLFDHLVHAK